MAPTDMRLERGDAGRSVDVVVGQTVSVSLTENPATGYRWTIDRLDTRILELDSAEFTAASHGGVGGAGVRTLRFRVVATGSTGLALKQWREWQGDDSVIERFGVTINATA